MAYNTILEERITDYLTGKSVDFSTRKMMGGLCYMLDDKMLAGIVKDQVMARINPDIYEESLEKEGCNEMNFTGRAMKGYLFIDEVAIVSDTDLAYWIDECLAFNPLAKASNKKKKKV